MIDKHQRHHDIRPSCSCYKFRNLSIWRRLNDELEPTAGNWTKQSNGSQKQRETANFCRRIEPGDCDVVGQIDELRQSAFFPKSSTKDCLR